MADAFRLEAIFMIYSVFCGYVEKDSIGLVSPLSLWVDLAVVHIEQNKPRATRSRVSPFFLYLPSMSKRAKSKPKR